jgi:hypothetical protein
MNLVVVPRRPVPPKIVVANCSFTCHSWISGFVFFRPVASPPTVDYEQSSSGIANQDIYKVCTF